jgi:uncharacterized repeat protein (TIGR01451 family)
MRFVVGLLVLTACLAAFGAPPAWALGTPAGTVIQNTAQVTYTVAGLSGPISISASDSFTVAEIIDAVLTWQDAADVPVNSPQTGRGMTFQLTNTGNGPERFRLSALANLGGDDFDPVLRPIYIESNGIPGLQSGGATPDTIYLPGGNDPDLAADGRVVFYVTADIPAGLGDGALGRMQTTAAAQTTGAAGAAVGTRLPGAGQGGQDAVVGSTQAQGTAVGRFLVQGLTVNLNKQIQRITDQFGGNQPYAGARVAYRVVVTVGGSGTVENLIVDDPIPTGMTYVPQSVRLNGAPQTDAADAPLDGTDFNITTVGRVTTQLGNVVAPATFTIDFETTININ